MIQYGYDFYGDLVTVTDAEGNVTRFTYDTNHTCSRSSTRSAAKASGRSMTSSGRVTEIIDSAGNAVTFTHDLPDRVETTTDAIGNVTTTAYDTQGNVVEQTDPWARSRRIPTTPSTRS